MLGIMTDVGLAAPAGLNAYLVLLIVGLAGRFTGLITLQAPYDILYYDANLDVYRTDRFAGWQNQPSNGTPLFTYGNLGYTLLTDATAQPSPEPSVEASASAIRGMAQPSCLLCVRCPPPGHLTMGKPGNPGNSTRWTARKP